MKKIVSLILVLTLALALAACGGDAPETTAPAAGGEMTPVTPAADAWGYTVQDVKIEMHAPADGHFGISAEILA